jgi:phosphatidylinositol 3-kinase
VAAVPQPATTAATHYHEADADDGATFSAGRLEDEHGVEPVAREVTSTFVSSFAAIDAQSLTSEATVAQAASPVSPSAEQPQLAEEEGGHRGARVDAADSASASTSRRPQPPLDEEPPRTSPSLLNTNATNVDSATSPEANSPTGDDTTKASRPLEGSAATTSSGRHARELQNFDVIFKCGDDIRQDQLVIQIIQILDAMLKQNGLDLCLTPYTVLATSVSDGFVEKVPNVETLQTVQRDMGGVVRYLQSKNHAPDAHKRALHRFVKSCAGYCVITFLLGIGDRHLENLLITTDGRLLHIDFGFIFGNDPKPFPPPMKINKEMVDAFGGVQSEGYASFKKYCCSAYIIIRKHAKLILSLLLLMVDASIPQIWDGKVDRRVNVLKVQEKLRLELSDAEATQYIQNVIADSVGSVFTNLWDVIHVAAQAARN